MGDVTRNEILQALVVTAFAMGGELPAIAAEDMANELAEYGGAAIIAALRRCKREVKGRLALVDVIERIEEDARPNRYENPTAHAQAMRDFAEDNRRADAWEAERKRLDAETRGE